VHIKGSGFGETPYHRLLVEEEINKPPRMMDFLMGIDRTHKILYSTNNARDKEQKLYDCLERQLKPLVIEKSKFKSEEAARLFGSKRPSKNEGKIQTGQTIL
jgi:hypothetical protein